MQFLSVHISVIQSASQYSILIKNKDIKGCTIDFSFPSISLYKVNCAMMFKHQSLSKTFIFTLSLQMALPVWVLQLLICELWSCMWTNLSWVVSNFSIFRHNFYGIIHHPTVSHSVVLIQISPVEIGLCNIFHIKCDTCFSTENCKNQKSTINTVYIDEAF